MPLYEYGCGICRAMEDHFRHIEQRNDAPLHCGKPMERHITPARVMGDIEPYFTVAADKETKKNLWIHSRKQHREYLKRNRYEEAGDDKLDLPQSTPESGESESIDLNSL